jgi:hypothetical protein
MHTCILNQHNNGMSKLFNYKSELPQSVLPESCSIENEDFVKGRLQYIKPDQTIDLLDRDQGIGSAQIYFYDSGDAISITICYNLYILINIIELRIFIKNITPLSKIVHYLK